jgi:hypothetical protein
MTKKELIDDLLTMAVISEEESAILMGPDLERLKDFDFWKDWKYNPEILDTTSTLDYEKI